jgi:hypothetical protein
MTIELTLGRTTFLIRREPAKLVAKVNACSPKTSSFVAAWKQTFNATWEAKAGACFPEQFSHRYNLTKRDETDE